MAACVRSGDFCSGHDTHEPRKPTSSSSNVTINGRGAVRETDTWENHCDSGGHACHTSAIETSTASGDKKGGSSTVFVNGLRMARVGDHISANGCVSFAAHGSGNVFAGG